MPDSRQDQEPGEPANFDPSTAPRYVGIPTFMRVPAVSDPSEVDIALIGVPYDGAAEARPGARHGPREIRNASSMMRPIHHVTRENPYEQRRVGDLGDVPLKRVFDIESSHAEIATFFTKVHAAGALPLAAGGDHSITLPILRALAAKRPVGLIHFDAHCDTWDTEFGSKYTHGTPFRRAVEEGLLDPKRTVQIGIRGAASSTEAWDFAVESGMRVIFMEEFLELGVEGVTAEARRVVGEGPTYLTFDIDGLDPAHAPGTGTPEVGGVTPREAMAFLRGLGGLNLIGADVVEVAPPLDPTGNTALVAATMMYEILCLLATDRKIR